MFFLRKISIVLAIVLCMPLGISAVALSDNEITAPSAVLIDQKTGKVLYEKRGAAYASGNREQQQHEVHPHRIEV